MLRDRRKQTATAWRRRK